MRRDEPFELRWRYTRVPRRPPREPVPQAEPNAPHRARLERGHAPGGTAQPHSDRDALDRTTHALSL